MLVGVEERLECGDRQGPSDVEPAHLRQVLVQPQCPAHLGGSSSRSSRYRWTSRTTAAASFWSSQFLRVGAGVHPLHLALPLSGSMERSLSGLFDDRPGVLGGIRVRNNQSGHRHCGEDRLVGVPVSVTTPARSRAGTRIVPRTAAPACRQTANLTGSPRIPRRRWSPGLR